MSRLLLEETLAMLGPAGFLAKVVSVQDPSSLNRVQVRLYNVDGVSDQDGAVWARVAVPFAGSNRGAFFFPDVGDEVLVIHLSGDARYPVIIGGLWNGADSAPDSFGETVDRWTITGKAGTKIAIIENADGPTIHFTTPGQLSGKMSDHGAGSIEFTNADQTSVKIDSGGVTVNAPSAEVKITAATGVTINAAQVTVNAAMATFSGIVKCQVMQATTVIASTYTPGAGNIW